MTPISPVVSPTHEQPNFAQNFNLTAIQYLTEGTEENAILTHFVELEKSDEGLFGSAAPQVAIRARRDMLSNYQINREALEEYLAFYGNDPDLVLELRKLVVEYDKVNSGTNPDFVPTLPLPRDITFFRSLYLKARQQPLFPTQFDAYSPNACEHPWRF